MSETKNPYIESAYERLQIISQDKEKRWEYIFKLGLSADSPNFTISL